MLILSDETHLSRESLGCQLSEKKKKSSFKANL